MTDDRTLFAGIRCGERAAFDSLFRRWYPVLLSYAMRFVCREDAENVVQDVMASIWKKAAVFPLPDNVSAYLYASVRNRCLNLLERSRNSEIYNSSVRMSVMESVDMLSDASAKELSARLADALGRLGEAQRRAFELHRFSGLKYSEIAEREGVSVKTVEYRMSEALRKLRIALSEWL